MKKLRIFYNFSRALKLMFLCNFVLCGVARASIHLLPLTRLSPYFGKFHRATLLSTLISPSQTDRARWIGRSVRLAAKYTPWNSSCLTQAMVAKFWCRLFHIPYVFYIGFAKSDTEPSGYAAHAWLMAGRVAVTGGDSFNAFGVISSYMMAGFSTHQAKNPARKASRNLWVDHRI
jgi:hypothetical protein